MNDRDAYFGIQDAKSKEQVDALPTGPMVATDLHSLIEANDTSAITSLVEEQLSDTKKIELIQYLQAHRLRFLKPHAVGPQHLDLFYDLMNQFPITCIIFGSELLGQFPELALWLQTSSQATITRQNKKTTKDTLEGTSNTKKGTVTLLEALASKIDPETLTGFADQVTQDVHNIHHYITTKSHVATGESRRNNTKLKNKDLKNQSFGETDEVGNRPQNKDLKNQSFGETAEVSNRPQNTVSQAGAVQHTPGRKKGVKIDLENGNLLEASPHGACRQSMVDWAKENDKSHAERIALRAKELELLSKGGKIQEDAEGVSIPEIGLKLASKAVQEKALNDGFGDKLQPNRGRNDHQNKQSGTKTVEKQDIDAHGSTFGARELCSNDQLQKICAWIRANFTDVKKSSDELYLLQMINPDLFERMWMKDMKGGARQSLRLARLVHYSFVSASNYSIDGAGLLLVQKCR